VPSLRYGGMVHQHEHNSDVEATAAKGDAWSLEIFSKVKYLFANCHFFFGEDVTGQLSKFYK
jgi:hypothetical protein